MTRFSALINLGYKPAEAKRAVDSVDGFDETDGLESLIRRSLAIILGEKYGLQLAKPARGRQWCGNI